MSINLELVEALVEAISNTSWLDIVSVAFFSCSIGSTGNTVTNSDNFIFDSETNLCC